MIVAGVDLRGYLIEVRGLVHVMVACAGKYETSYGGWRIKWSLAGGQKRICS